MTRSSGISQKGELACSSDVFCHTVLLQDQDYWEPVMHRRMSSWSGTKHFCGELSALQERLKHATHRNQDTILNCFHMKMLV